MHYSTIRRKDGKIPTQENLTWPEIVERLRTPIEGVPKDDLPLFSLCGYRKYRNDIDATAASGVTFDGDALSEEELNHLLRWASQYTYLLYTTNSHGTVKGNCVRLVFPFETDWTGHPDDFKAKLKSVWESAGLKYDIKCCNIARFSFLPSLNPDGGPFEFCTNEGKFLSLPSGTPATTLRVALSAPVEYTRSVFAEDVVKLAKRLAKQEKSKEYAQTGRELLACLQGDRFASPGRRDNGVGGGRGSAVLQMAARCAEEFPNVDPYEVGALLRLGLENTGHLESETGKGDDPVEDFVRHMTKFQVDVCEKLEREKIEREKLLIFQERLSLKHENVSSVSEQSAPLLLVDFTCSKYRVRWRAHQNQYSDLADRTGAKFLLAQEWGDLLGAETIESMRDDWDAFASQFGRRIGTTVMRYAVAGEKESCIGTLSSDPKAVDLSLVVGGFSTIEPKHSPRVDEWLKALCCTTAAYNDLVAWISVATHTSVPVPLLYVSGPSGSGKSTLAAGIGNMWVNGGVDQTDRFCTFNEAAIKSPVILFREEILSHINVDLLKETVTEEIRVIQRKGVSYRPALSGHARLICDSNGFKMPSRNGRGRKPTQEDTDALKARILYIETRSEGAMHLSRMSEECRWADVQKEITAHMLSLQQCPGESWHKTRLAAPVGFHTKIETTADEMIQEAAISTAELEERQRWCEAVSSYVGVLLEQPRLPVWLQPHERGAEGYICVKVRKLIENFIRDGKVSIEKTRAIRSAVASMNRGAREIRGENFQIVEIVLQ